MLDDGSNTYVYGLERVAQTQGAQYEYFLGDALNSVRQLADASGAIVLTRAYEPYGSPAAVAGPGASMYGFTGEQQDATGLVYLRARYYAAAMGRFISRDTWEGSLQQPLSRNRWNYVQSNPLAHVDPTGHIADCGPFERADLTQWMIDELNADRQSWVITQVRTFLQASKLNQEVPSAFKPGAGYVDPAAYGLLVFADAVRPGGLWDFKRRIAEIVGQNIRMADNWYFHDVPGDVAFGYLGRAAGIDEQTLHCGADAANDNSILGFCSGHDRKDDFIAIEAGFELWEVSAGGPIHLQMLSNTFRRYALSKGRATEPLPKAFEPGIWPYRVGSFDGKSLIAHR